MAGLSPTHYEIPYKCAQGVLIGLWRVTVALRLAGCYQAPCRPLYLPVTLVRFRHIIDVRPSHTPLHGSATSRAADLAGPCLLLPIRSNRRGALFHLHRSQIVPLAGVVVLRHVKRETCPAYSL